MESTNQQTEETTSNTSLVDLQLRKESLEFILWAIREVAAPRKVTDEVLKDIQESLKK